MNTINKIYKHFKCAIFFCCVKNGLSFAGNQKRKGNGNMGHGLGLGLGLGPGLGHGDNVAAPIIRELS